jgi:hypothetical protein
MAVIFTGATADGKPYPPLSEMADAILEVAPDETIRYVKGSTSGVLVSEKAAVLYLMQRYTASGNLRKGK